MACCEIGRNALSAMSRVKLSQSAVLFLVITVILISFRTTDVSAAEKSAESEYAIHNYTAKFRASAWFTFVDGELVGENPVNSEDFGLELDGDLGYDDPYPTFILEGAYRNKRHDFWITGTRFDESETGTINASFEIGDKVFEIGGDVSSKFEMTDVDFRYGYSFYTYKEDGFRFGPTIAVSYTEFDIEIREVILGNVGIPADWEYSDQVPIPTIGMHLEIPYKELLFAGQLGGFYFEADNFEGTGIRSEFSVTWRPYDHIGFYAGFYSIYADLELKNEDIDDLFLFGPSVGLEVRF